MSSKVSTTEHVLVSPCCKGVATVSDCWKAGQPKGHKIAQSVNSTSVQTAGFFRTLFLFFFVRRTIFLRRTIDQEECAKSFLTPPKCNPTHSSQQSFFSFFLMKNCFSFSLPKTSVRTIHLVRTMVCRENDCLWRERWHGKRTMLTTTAPERTMAHDFQIISQTLFSPMCAAARLKLQMCPEHTMLILHQNLASWRTRQHERRQTSAGHPRLALRGLGTLLVIVLVVLQRLVAAFRKRIGRIRNRKLTTHGHLVKVSHILLLAQNHQISSAKTCKLPVPFWFESSKQQWVLS